MKKGPLNPKYIRIEVRIDLLTMNISRIDQVVGIEDSTQVIGLDNTIEMVVLEEILGDMEDRIVEEDIEMINIMIIIEAETGQEKGHLQEIIVVVVVEIGVQATADLDQAPELIQIEIGLDVIIAENMTILQEIILILEKRENWKGYKKCWIWKLKDKPTDKIAT